MNEFSSHELKIVKSEFEKHSENNSDYELLTDSSKPALMLLVRLLLEAVIWFLIQQPESLLS